MVSRDGGTASSGWVPSGGGGRWSRLVVVGMVSGVPGGTGRGRAGGPVAALVDEGTGVVSRGLVGLTAGLGASGAVDEGLGS